MISRCLSLCVLGFLATVPASSSAQESRYARVVPQILAAWESADVVCLGEDHGRKHDSDLRIALVSHPAFVRTVDLVVVEFANPVHNDILDRLVLEGENVPVVELRRVWQDALGWGVWDSPVYEQFVRAVRDANLKVPREERVRVIGADAPIDWRTVENGEALAPLLNRGRFIRETIASEVLDQGLKALAIFGSGHCEHEAMGFPGELADRYPGRFWVAFNFYGSEGVAEGKRVFTLGAEPQLILIRGTERAGLPATKMFFRGRHDDATTLGDLLDAIVYHGDVPDVVVHADSAAVTPADRRELARRYALMEEARRVLQRQMQRRP